MWVSQTYLTNLRADGAAAAYFLYEDYKRDQAALEHRIRPQLGSLAMSFGDSAHVFVPSEDQREAISREFNDWICQKGMEIELPGVLILEYAMSDERSYEGFADFVSFAPLLDHPEQSEAVLEQLQRALVALRDEMKNSKSGLEHALRNVQLKPGVWGFNYDLKPRLLDWARRLRL